MKIICLLTCIALIPFFSKGQSKLEINKNGYFEVPGLNVTVFSDIYPEGHQTGITIIQHGQRVVANGDIRLEVSPGQWSPIPKGGKQTIDEQNQIISQSLWYPDSSKNRKGFNPIDYPDLILKYKVNVSPLENNSFKVTIDLEHPVPNAWLGKIGFNMEIFPTHVFGKTFNMDGETGLFPVQANGALAKDQDHFITQPLAVGKTLTIVPENDLQRIKFETKGELGLYDGRGNHNNGWFIIREVIKSNTTQNALEWIVTPNVSDEWKYEPVIHVSQVGYHPNQTKTIVIETDARIQSIEQVELLEITPEGPMVIKSYSAPLWGKFLRFNYFNIDFTNVKKEGMYQIKCGNIVSNPFKIDDAIYQNHVWQPVIDYFLPVQMCHMRVEENYRVWHDHCHNDDAIMAPTSFNHFDGYKQGESTRTKYQSNEPVDGLNEGGWHDAGDYDLRVESQIQTVELLALMIQEFDLNYDATSIDEKNHLVEIHKADGKNDLVQQIEHGLKSILGGYRALGRLYRGIICQTLEQYTMLGDAAAMTDNIKWDDSKPQEENDDRWVFTENNSSRECMVGTGLANASIALRPYNKELAEECLTTALALWETSGKTNNNAQQKASFASTLLIATKDQRFTSEIYQLEDEILKRSNRIAWRIGMALPLLTNKSFKENMQKAVEEDAKAIALSSTKSPFGVPYKPHIWGHAWTNQRFGVQQYYTHKAWPHVTSAEPFLNALNFNLGVHPGENTSSYASGVGSKSVLTAYGVNRADWSYIPGGVVSGTNLVRPDLPELKEWPYFWQQTEYVMGGGSTNFMFLVLAVDKYLNKH